MQNRHLRSSILAFLIAVGIGAGYLLWDSHRQSIATAERSRTLNAALDAILSDVADLSAAQQAYVAPGQSDGPWIARVSSLLQRLYDQAAALRSAGGAAESAARTMGESLDAIVAIDSHAREYLRMGEDLMASDLVFNDARESLAAMTAAVKTLKVVDAAAHRDALAGQGVLQASVLGVAAGLWLVGMLVLMRAPNPETLAASVEVPALVEVPAEPRIDAPAAAPVQAPIDWQRAANVCGDLARLTDGAQLPGIIGNIGRALDAPGVILWLGAGEQLFAAAAHGYEARVVSRLGQIDRGADNATAAAWRTALLQTVAADAVANGAIVAPVVGPSGCRGALAVEVRPGRESDPAVQSVVSMIGAQLGGLVAAWPPASATAEESPVQQAINL